LNDLIREVIAVVHGELESHQVILQTELRDGLPAVLAEQTQLQQVILNLIMNAVDAMGSVADRDRVVIVRSDMDGSAHTLITVEDSGTGIEPSHMSRIFEPFFTTKAHGMGMGLSICHSIIELHGGQLQVSARSPYGSIFCAKLPTVASGNFRDAG
jgi:signal transduction histidine kinase